MRTDLIRKEQAILLRQQGMSIKAIANQLPAAQSSVSIWVKGIELSAAQKQNLKNNTHSRETIEKRRQSRLSSERKKRDAIIKQGMGQIGELSDRELMLICTSLYWGEGSKTSGLFQFSNSDPRMIQVMLRFLRDVCNVDETKLRAYIHLHEHLDVQRAEKYWQQITQISKNQFYKTYNKKNRSSKGKRDTLPYGVCDIYVMDAKLLLMIFGWMQGIYLSATTDAGQMV